MTIIPLNNQTMGFDSEVYNKILREREAAQQERDKMEEMAKKREKAEKPFWNELKKLRKDELERLLTDENFVKHCNDYKKKGWLTKEYYIQKPAARCGYDEIDLVSMYGSSDYKEKVKVVHDTIDSLIVY